MPSSAFYESYKENIGLYRDVNRLIDLNDRYGDILDNLPDPNAKEVFSLESDIELLQDRYNTFYFSRRRCLKKAQKILDVYVDLLEGDNFSLLLGTLNDMVETLTPVNDVARVDELYAVKDSIQGKQRSWGRFLLISKDSIADNLQGLVNESAEDTKKDPKTDDQRSKELKTSAFNRMKDPAIQSSVSSEKTTELVVEQNLRRFTEKVGALKYIDQALKNFTDSTFFDSIKTNISNGPPWFRAIILGDTSVTISKEDKLKGTFTLQNLLLRRRIRKSGALEDDTDKVDAYWREKIRRRYGKDALFCDETRASDGSIVKEDDLEAEEAIRNGQARLQEKIQQQTIDDH